MIVTFAWSWCWWCVLLAGDVVVEHGQGWPSHLPRLLGPAWGALAGSAVLPAASAGWMASARSGGSSA